MTPNLSTLLTLSPYTSAIMKPHYSGKGTHIKVTYPNGHRVSITTNTSNMDANDTFEILTSATINPSDDNNQGQLYRQTYDEITQHLLTIAKS